jgi:DNA-directed RNA polymerase specialized sigma24 family protein
MDSSGSVTRWSAELRSPDPRTRDEAARQIWERFSARLAALVRRRLDARLSRREGEDDILQSMFKSFCLGQLEAKEPLRSRDDLWKLLVWITMCKVANAAHRHRAACRDYRREVIPAPQGSDDAPFPDWMLEAMDCSEPELEQAEEVERLIQALPDDLRQIMLWALEGETNKQIAERIGRTERMVELKRQQIRVRLGRFIESDR